MFRLISASKNGNLEETKLLLIEFSTKLKKREHNYKIVSIA